MAETKNRRGRQAEAGAPSTDNLDGLDVADPERQQMTVADHAPDDGARLTEDSGMQTLFNWLVDKAQRDDTDDASSMEAMVRQILQGGSAEEVLREQLPMSSKTFLDQPFALHGFTITESEFAEGPIPFYANLSITVRGESRIVNAGGLKTLAQLFVLDREGEYPYYCKFVGKQTSKGHTVVTLVQAN